MTYMSLALFVYYIEASPTTGPPSSPVGQVNVTSTRHGSLLLQWNRPLDDGGLPLR